MSLINAYLNANGSVFYANLIGSAICFTTLSYRKQIVAFGRRINGTHMRYLVLGLGSNIYLTTGIPRDQRFDVLVGLSAVLIALGDALLVHGSRLLFQQPSREEKPEEPERQPETSATLVKPTSPVNHDIAAIQENPIVEKDDSEMRKQQDKVADAKNRGTDTIFVDLPKETKNSRTSYFKS